MRTSEQNDRGRTPICELCIFSIANFAYALSSPAPRIPKSGLKSLSIRTLPILGGRGLKPKTDSCKLTAHESKPFAASHPVQTGLLPIPYSLSSPRSGPKSSRSRTLHTFAGEGSARTFPLPRLSQIQACCDSPQPLYTSRERHRIYCQNAGV